MINVTSDDSVYKTQELKSQGHKVTYMYVTSVLSTLWRPGL